MSMKNVIPFTKEIIFKSNIAEISSISLEHEYTIEDDKICGNFIVSGDYKSHELSINKDLFKYNKDFSVIYNAKNKYTVIVFTPRNYMKENKNAFGPFYQKGTKLISMYPDSFNIIERNEFAKPKYLLRYDRTAYKDLKEYCGSFCIINPKDDTMFVFKHVSNSELGALEVLFQQYHFMLK